MAVVRAREAFSRLVEGNAYKLQEWLDQVAEKDPKAALEIVVKVAEYVLPKMARQELPAQNEPTELIIRWMATEDSPVELA